MVVVEPSNLTPRTLSQQREVQRRKTVRRKNYVMKKKMNLKKNDGWYQMPVSKQSGAERGSG